MSAFRHRLGFVTALLLGFTLLFGELACGCGPHEEGEQHADNDAVPCSCITHSGAVETSVLVATASTMIRAVALRPTNDRLPEFLLGDLIFQPPRA